jgi:hypothetical protein
MTSGLSHFFAFGLAARCNFVHRRKAAGQTANARANGCASRASAIGIVRYVASEVRLELEFRQAI